MAHVRDYDKFMLRLPAGMRDAIKASAERNDRSMNAEIIARLSGDTETLRDKVAGQAMQASMAGHISHYGHENHWFPKDVAAWAYEVADAMLAARKGGAQ